MAEIGLDQFPWGLEHLPKYGSVMQLAGMILGDVLRGRVVEVNESPKSHALPCEVRKDDCHSGLLVRLLGIMR